MHTSISSTPSLSSVASTTSDRKSTRLNSSHSQISYAVFCLKKKQYKQPVERPHFVKCNCRIYAVNCYASHTLARCPPIASLAALYTRSPPPCTPLQSPDEL